MQGNEERHRFLTSIAGIVQPDVVRTIGRNVHSCLMMRNLVSLAGEAGLVKHGMNVSSHHATLSVWREETKSNVSCTFWWLE